MGVGCGGVGGRVCVCRGAGVGYRQGEARGVSVERVIPIFMPREQASLRYPRRDPIAGPHLVVIPAYRCDLYRDVPVSRLLCSGTYRPRREGLCHDKVPDAKARHATCPGASVPLGRHPQIALPRRTASAVQCSEGRHVADRAASPAGRLPPSNSSTLSSPSWHTTRHYGLGTSQRKT